MQAGWPERGICGTEWLWVATADGHHEIRSDGQMPQVALLNTECGPVGTTDLYHHPAKGLSGEKAESAEVTSGS